MEWFKTLLDNMANFLQTKMDFLDMGIYSPAIYIAFGGIALIFLAFIIALIAKGSSRNNKLQKNLEDCTAYINVLGTVDEENVGELNARLQQTTSPILKGWGYFLEQQMGYPSDYITEKEVLEGSKKALKNGGKSFFKVISAIVILVGIAAAALGCKDMFFDISAEKVTLVALAIGGALAGPLLAYVIFLAILNGTYKGEYKKLRVSFYAFQDALDNAVIIFREEQDEFISENIEEINATIEEILANKLDNREIIEIVTTPVVSEEMEVYEEQELEPVSEVEEPELAKEEEPQITPTPEEEIVATVLVEDEEQRRGERLVQLVLIASRASKDNSITEEQLLELSEVIYNAKTSGDYPSVDEQEIFDDCLRILAQKYYKN